MLKKPKKANKTINEDLRNEALVLATDRYVVRLIAFLQDGRPHRYYELADLLGKTSQPTLSRKLRLMEKNGLIKRKLYFELPPRVEYRLTSFGQKLVPAARAILDWVEQHFFYLGGYQNKWEFSQTKDRLRE